MRLMRLASGYQISQAIIVAARLKIAEHLVAGPKTSEQLARITNTHAPSLYRLARLVGRQSEYGPRTRT